MAYLYILNSHLNSEQFLQQLRALPADLVAHKVKNSNQAVSVALIELEEKNLSSIRVQLESLSCDYIYSESKLELPKLVVFDMDSTLIPIEVIDELARFANKKAEVSAVTELAMQGQLDFNQSLIKRVKHLKGLSSNAIQQLASELTFNPGVENFCQYLINKGSKVAIASGGFVPFAQALQRKVNFSFIRANQLQIKNDELTGEVVGTIINAEEKAKALVEWAEEMEISLNQAMAVGDGANDLAMIDKAGIGLAYDAKPKVNQSANSILKFNSMDALIDLFEFAQATN